MSASAVGAKCELLDGKWVVTGDPFMLFKMEQFFSLSKRVGNSLVIPATPEQARDIQWFRQRFPMEVVPERRIRTDAAKHMVAAVHANNALSEGYVPAKVDFANDLQPRQYQSVAAEVWKATGQLLLADEVGLGKAQPLNAMVLCSNGWKRMGDIVVGDEVIDPEGGTGRVTGVFDRGTMEVFEVRTNDGRVTRCSDDHLWEVRTVRDRLTGRSRVLPLREIRKDLRKGTGHRQFRYALPVCEAFELSLVNQPRHVKLPINPYVLGCLLGDGGFKDNSITFTSADEAVVQRLSSHLPKPVSLVKAGRYEYRVSVGNISGSGRHKNPLVIRCRQYGLMGKLSYEKSLPEFVWRGTINDRKELLAGLLDTDGTATKEGGVFFSSTSEQLIDQVRMLIESLGGFASKTTRQTKFTYNGVKKLGRRSWQLNIRLPFNPFHHPAKKARYKKPYMARLIVDVQPVGFEPVRCIAVSTAKNTYVTDGAIVTHNTVSVLAAISDEVMRPCCIVMPVHLGKQWQHMTNRFLPGLSVHEVDSTTPYKLDVFAECKSCGKKTDLRRLSKRRGLRRCQECKGPLESRTQYPDVVLVAYSKIRHWPGYIGEMARTVVFEEAHALRRCESDRWAAARSLAAMVEYRIALSGTPIFNYGGEIWNVMECVAPGALGPKDTFRKTWCAYSGESKEPMLKDPEAFGEYLRSNHLMLRRTTKDVGLKTNEVIRYTCPVDADASIYAKETGRASELARIILDDAKRAGIDRMQASGEFDTIVRKATGLAKCMAPDTKVLRGDGESVEIQTIKVGDYVMTPSGKPAKVLAVSKGRAPMYRISSTGKSPLFQPFVVNGEHILAMKWSGKVRSNNQKQHDRYAVGDHLEISAKEFFESSRFLKHVLKAYVSDRMEFSEASLPVDPYFLGLWLGDGSSDSAAITTSDVEIRDYVYSVATQYSLRVRVKQGDRKAPTYCIAPKGAGGNCGKRYKGYKCRNQLLADMQSIGVIRNKHIPKAYKFGSVSQRVALLSGLVDSDGTLCCPGMYSITSKWEGLANDIAFVARTLGLAAKVRKLRAKSQSGYEVDVWRVSITGNGVADLQLKVPHKRSPARKQIKNPCHTGVKIEEIGEGDYYGITIEGDGLYLLADFVVTHNSAYVAAFVEMLLEQGEPVVLFGWHRAVYDVWMEKLAKWSPVLYSGSESSMQKEAAKHRFITGDTRLFIMSLRSGEGLDGLQQVCATTVHGELDWSPAVHSQNIGRVARDGQERVVKAYFLLSDYGMDPIIAEVLGLKLDQSESLLGAKSLGPQKKVDASEAIKKLAREYLERSA